MTHSFIFIFSLFLIVCFCFFFSSCIFCPLFFRFLHVSVAHYNIHKHNTDPKQLNTQKKNSIIFKLNIPTIHKFINLVFRNNFILFDLCAMCTKFRIHVLIGISYADLLKWETITKMTTFLKYLQVLSAHALHMLYMLSTILYCTFR